MGAPSRIDPSAQQRLRSKSVEARQNPKSDFASRIKEPAPTTGADPATHPVSGGDIMSASMNGGRLMDSQLSSVPGAYQRFKGDFGSQIKEGMPGFGGQDLGVTAAGLGVAGSAILSSAMNGRNPMAVQLSSRGVVRAAVRRVPGTSSKHSKDSAASSEVVSSVHPDTAAQGAMLRDAQRQSNMRFIVVQNAVSSEDRECSATSNAIKADPAENTIKNIHA